MRSRAVEEMQLAEEQESKLVTWFLDHEFLAGGLCGAAFVLLLVVAGWFL